jgi:hypothetical protein
MRPIKRLLFFASEGGILILGLILSSAVAFGLGFIAAEGIGAFAFYFCFLLILIAFFVARRRHRSWKIEYDAVGWQLSQAEYKLHPVRTRDKRIVGRMLLCVPSLIAAFVLCFSPVASHLAHPRSHYLRHYRIPIPWTFTVFPEYGRWVRVLVSGSGADRFGLTPFWDRNEILSLMNIAITDPDPGMPMLIHTMKAAKRLGATRLLDREFRSNGVAFSCFQFMLPHGSPSFAPSFGAGPYWRVLCESQVDVYQQCIYAEFFGHEADIPAFYKTIEGVTPVK